MATHTVYLHQNDWTIQIYIWWTCKVVNLKSQILTMWLLPMWDNWNKLSYDTRSIVTMIVMLNVTFCRTTLTALHGMQTRSSDENSVCLSVCLSVLTRGLWQNARKICADFYTIRMIFSLVFWERLVAGGDSFYLKFRVNWPPLILVFWEEWLVGVTAFTLNVGSTDPRWSEIADFEPIIARSASAVTPSEKKFN